MRSLATGLAGLLFLTGCVEGFDSPTEILSNRVLGARLEIAGDLARAWPRAGENVAVRWFVVDPAEAAPLTYAFLVCEAGAAEATSQFCGKAPFATAVVTTPTMDEPRIAFKTPAKASRLLLQGVICANGTPVVDVAKASAKCIADPVDDADAGPALRPKTTLVTKTIFVVDDDAATNRHPVLFGAAPIAVRRTTADGPVVLTQAGLVPLEDCRDEATAEGVPVLVAKKNMEFEMPVDPRDREFYETADGDRLREELELGCFSSGGEFNKTYMVVDDRYESRRSLYWDAPKAEDLPKDGRLTRFFFVLRDARGGEEWTTRAACIVPD